MDEADYALIKRAVRVGTLQAMLIVMAISWLLAFGGVFFWVAFIAAAIGGR